MSSSKLITGMCETAHAVSERLLRAFSRGSLWILVSLRAEITGIVWDETELLGAHVWEQDDVTDAG